MARRRVVCIVCRKHKKGYPVMDDVVIKSIRLVKERFGVASGNRLVVCKDCVQEYEKRRKRFTRYLAFHSLLAIVIVGLSALISFTIRSIVLSILLAAFVLLLSLLSYFPKAEIPGKD